MHSLTSITYGTLRERAVALDRQNSLAYLRRGDTKSALSSLQNAIADYDRAIAIDPQNISAYLHRGDAKSTLGEEKNFKDAIADYDRAISLQERSANASDPQNIAIYLRRGDAKHALKDYKGAIADYDYLRYATRTSNCDRSSKQVGLS